MSRAPVKPPAKKVTTAQVVTPKRNPSKRAPKRAVAVETHAEAMAPGHVSARARPNRDDVAEAAISLWKNAPPSDPSSPKPKPKSSRQKMLEAQKALQEKCKADDRISRHKNFKSSLARGDVARKSALAEWEDTHFPKDYATENAEARRRANRDTVAYACVVFGIIAVVCVYVFWWSWK